MNQAMNLSKQNIQLKTKHPLLHNIRKHYNLYLMILPAVVLFVLFYYMPMYGIIIAFKDYDLVDGILGSKFIGFEHFKNFFQDPYCFRIIKNTLLIGFYNLFWSFWPPIVFAILLNELKWNRLRKTIQTISYLPYFIAIVVIVGMMMDMLGPTGIVNRVLNSFGIETINFFNEDKYFRSMYIISGIWQNMGYNSIIYMAAIAGIDQEQFEAAYIDGANRFQRIWHISVPGIMPTMTVLLILNAASIVNVGFEKVYLMYSPATYNTADVISTYVYRRGITDMDFGYGTAIGLLNSVIAFLLLFTANKIAAKVNDTSLW